MELNFQLDLIEVLKAEQIIPTSLGPFCLYKIEDLSTLIFRTQYDVFEERPRFGAFFNAGIYYIHAVPLVKIAPDAIPRFNCLDSGSPSLWNIF